MLWGLVGKLRGLLYDQASVQQEPKRDVSERLDGLRSSEGWCLGNVNRGEIGTNGGNQRKKRASKLLMRFVGVVRLYVQRMMLNWGIH